MSLPDESAGDLTHETERAYRYECASDESPSEAVVRAVAAAASRPATPLNAGDDGATSLSPLYDHVDPDALDALVTGGDDRDAGGSVAFRYDGYAVSVCERAVTVSPAE